MTSVAIIPARYASTRFPGKPLALLGDKPLVMWAYVNALRVFDKVFVATDDVRIYNAVVAFGGRSVMTSPEHATGTSRIYEACQLLGLDADIIVNLQGDEPFINTSDIHALIDTFDDENVNIATLVSKFSHSTTFAEISEPDTVKVVIDSNNDAMYFSRSVVPYVRGHEPETWTSCTAYYKHVGIYGFRPHVLEPLVNLPESPLEIAESLEQLRWLQNGYKIRCAFASGFNIGIDTPDDLEKARRHLLSKI